MEHLPEDVMLSIFRKIPASGTKNLFRFRATSYLHCRLSNKKVVLMALPRECLCYISDHWPSAAKRKFMQQISRNGHEAYCVLIAAQLLQERCPNLEEIKLILKKAESHGSVGAKYLLLMFKVLAKDGFSMDEVLSDFKDLFERKQLAVSLVEAFTPRFGVHVPLHFNQDL